MSLKAMPDSGWPTKDECDQAASSYSQIMQVIALAKRENFGLNDLTRANDCVAFPASLDNIKADEEAKMSQLIQRLYPLMQQIEKLLPLFLSSLGQETTAEKLIYMVCGHLSMQRT